MNESNIPVGRKILAVIIMVSLAYLYWNFGSGISRGKNHKTINAQDIVSITMIYKDKNSREVKNDTEAKKIIYYYNKIGKELPINGKIDPDITAYIILKNGELYIATYNNQEVIVQYKNDMTNKQYLAKSSELVKLLKQI